jgi:hypothetical protein
VVAGVEVKAGGRFTGGGALTVIEKLCSSVRPPGSVTRTVTAWLPTWVLVGVQEIRPVAGLIPMPAGAAGSEKVSVSPVLVSVAPAS